MRLRDRVSTCPGKILRHNTTLNQNGLQLYDGRAICIQILDRDEVLPGEEEEAVLAPVPFPALFPAENTPEPEPGSGSGLGVMPASEPVSVSVPGSASTTVPLPPSVSVSVPIPAPMSVQDNSYDRPSASAVVGMDSLYRDSQAAVTVTVPVAATVTVADADVTADADADATVTADAVVVSDTTAAAAVTAAATPEGDSTIVHAANAANAGTNTNTSAGASYAETARKAVTAPAPVSSPAPAAHFAAIYRPLGDHKHIGDAVVLVQRWLRLSWTLGPRFEVALEGNMTVRGICKRLAKLVDIPVDRMRTLVVPLNTEVHLHELPKSNPTRYHSRQWFDGSRDTRKLRDISDMRLRDGDLLLVQDCDEPLRPLTPAEQLSVQLVSTADKGSYGDYSSYGTAASTTHVTWDCLGNGVAVPAGGIVQRPALVTTTASFGLGAGAGAGAGVVSAVACAAGDGVTDTTANYCTRYTYVMRGGNGWWYLREEGWQWIVWVMGVVCR